MKIPRVLAVPKAIRHEDNYLVQKVLYLLVSISTSVYMIVAKKDQWHSKPRERSKIMILHIHKLL